MLFGLRPDLVGWAACNEGRPRDDIRPDFEVAIEPDANIVCFRHTPNRVHDLDEFQVRIREEIIRGGDFCNVQTRLPCGVHLRVTIINARTTEDDLRGLVDAIRTAGMAVRARIAIEQQVTARAGRPPRR